MVASLPADGERVPSLADVEQGHEPHNWIGDGLQPEKVDGASQMGTSERVGGQAALWNCRQLLPDCCKCALIAGGPGEHGESRRW